MGKCIINLDGKFMLWSSVTDAPESPLLPEPLFKNFWHAEYGRSGWLDYEDRMDIAKKSGCSAHGYTVNQVISNNRAGEKEKKLTKKEIIEAYTSDSPEEFLQWSAGRDKAFIRLIEDFGPKSKTTP